MTATTATATATTAAAASATKTVVSNILQLNLHKMKNQSPALPSKRRRRVQFHSKVEECRYDPHHDETDRSMINSSNNNSNCNSKKRTIDSISNNSNSNDADNTSTSNSIDDKSRRWYSSKQLLKFQVCVRVQLNILQGGCNVDRASKTKFILDNDWSTVAYFSSQQSTRRKLVRDIKFKALQQGTRTAALIHLSEDSRQKALYGAHITYAEVYHPTRPETVAETTTTMTMPYAGAHIVG